jgi:hypothetical protein
MSGEGILLGKTRYNYIHVNIFHSMKYKLVMYRKEGRGLFANREAAEEVPFKERLLCKYEKYIQNVYT